MRRSVEREREVYIYIFLQDALKSIILFAGAAATITLEFPCQTRSYSAQVPAAAAVVPS